VLGAQSGWDRTDMLRLARNEIDSAMRLRQLLLSAKGPLLDLAPAAAEETSRRLGPDLPAQLKRKMDIMNAHWEDYQRLFTTPNP
jgi:aromatic ring-opening dioxygenase catalytic subunit (LigB family)